MNGIASVFKFLYHSTVESWISRNSCLCIFLLLGSVFAEFTFIVREIRNILMRLLVVRDMRVTSPSPQNLLLFNPFRPPHLLGFKVFFLISLVFYKDPVSTRKNFKDLPIIQIPPFNFCISSTYRAHSTWTLKTKIIFIQYQATEFSHIFSCLSLLITSWHANSFVVFLQKFVEN